MYLGTDANALIDWKGFLREMRSTQPNAMKQMEMEGDSPYLPEEIIVEILKRFPVKSLIQFQLLCKHWKNLIKTPYFINQHLQHSSHQNTYLLLEGIVPWRHLQLYMPDRDMQFLKVQIPPEVDPLTSASFIGSSNGLLCIRSSESIHKVILWNPAIREVKLEPIHLEDKSFKMGFGFSSKVNDYKVVFISGFTANNKRVHQVDVYSLSTGSWKKVESGNLSDDVVITSNGKTINGAIFWFGDKLNVEKGGENDGHLLVSYDIAKEVFEVIPLPISNPKPKVPDSLRYRLAVHEDKLALLSHTTIGDKESLINLWVMEEDTGTSVVQIRSWTKKYSFSHTFLLLPATIWKNEIVCHFLPGRPGAEPKVKGFEANIVLANLTTNKFKRSVIMRYGRGYDIFNYVESLVSVRVEK